MANVKDLETLAKDQNWMKFLTTYNDVYADRDKNKPMDERTRDAKSLYDGYQMGGGKPAGDSGMALRNLMWSADLRS